MNKKTVIIGASTNPGRYAYQAAERLTRYGFEFVPVGIRRGEIFGKKIQDLKERPHIDDVHTITLYINPDHQREWQDYLLSLQPERIIFNPGTENVVLAGKAREAGVEVLEGCTLVMLNTGQY